MAAILASRITLFRYEGHTRFYNIDLMVLFSVKANIPQNEYVFSNFLMYVILIVLITIIRVIC